MFRYKFSLIFFVFLSTSISAQSEVYVYETFADFQNDHGTAYDEFLSFSNALAHVTLKFKKSGVKYRIKCADIWGYSYKGVLFRVDQKLEQPTRVICSNDDLVYYENGLAHMDMLRTNSPSGSFAIGYSCYFSKTINSQMFPVHNSPVSVVSKRYKDFMYENPKLKPLESCIGNIYSYTHVRGCVMTFMGIETPFSVEDAAHKFEKKKKKKKD
ncbi:MAG: hypothetical protein KDC34_13160 [Saprospiraceae bacterium]|nr:hypothetical protein [Saprospiraceae bacterium]